MDVYDEWAYNDAMEREDRRLSSFRIQQKMAGASDRDIDKVLSPLDKEGGDAV